MFVVFWFDHFIASKRFDLTSFSHTACSTCAYKNVKYDCAVFVCQIKISHYSHKNQMTDGSGISETDINN